MLAQATTYQVTAVRAGGEPAPFSPVLDHFAPAQFNAMSDADKISSPSFVDLPAGIALASDAVTAGAGMETPVQYETVIVDSPTVSRPDKLYSLPGGHMMATAQGSAAARASMRKVGERKFAKDPKRPSVAKLDAQLFVVATRDTLAVRKDITSPVSKGVALQALATYLRSNPRGRGMLQVVPQSDAKLAA